MLIEISIDIIIFSVFITVLFLLKDKIINFLNKADQKNLKASLEKWIPIEQAKEFKQLFYLIFAGLLIADLYYLIIINTSLNFIMSFVIFDFIMSVLAGVYIYDRNKKLKTFIILITLVPLTGYSITGFNGNIPLNIFIILEVIHSLGIIYIIYNAIQDFRLYSKLNKLGYTILLLYIIVIICVFLTTSAEELGLLDSLVYCSNAFTSNGYGLVNATNASSKIISLILVWAGYILASVSTSLLTLALVSRYYKKRLINLKTRVRKQDAQLKEINEKLDKLIDQEIK